MITLGGSAFKPYYRPSLLTTSNEGQSPSDNISPLSILTDFLNAGVVPTDLQATLMNATTSLQPPSAARAAPTVTSCHSSAVEAAVGGGKAKRKRTTFTASQAAYLEKEYDSDQYMPRSRRIAVADSLQLSENQIKTWFQNRRAKDKKIRTVTTTSTAVLLPSSSPIHSPALSASSSSSSPPLSTPLQPLQVLSQSDSMPSLIELLALGKADLLPLLNSQLLNSISSLQASTSSSQ
ncbi:hypothetical protein PMAYCL1PPCAC_04463 [Pristionchus mayeri]|uniref:Homeobox domain-containing protein n=1 Tax=Pristionchus mayeri TaxID=1317129 RepID=A0AAN4Z4Q7_9BILA|nr:hypothetical protein PMAYCL1PPCAC_04463 [Pristionchus mayeri]